MSRLIFTPEHEQRQSFRRFGVSALFRLCFGSVVANLPVAGVFLSEVNKLGLNPVRNEAGVEGFI